MLITIFFFKKKEFLFEEINIFQMFQIYQITCYNQSQHVWQTNNTWKVMRKYAPFLSCSTLFFIDDHELLKLFDFFFLSRYSYFFFKGKTSSVPGSWLTLLISIFFEDQTCILISARIQQCLNRQNNTSFVNYLTILQHYKNYLLIKKLTKQNLILLF